MATTTVLGQSRRKAGAAGKPAPEGGAWDWFVKFFSTAFYAGFVPVAPGTAGALVGMLLWYLWGLLSMRPYSTLLLFLGIYVAGVALTARAKEIFYEADHNLIVVDEMLGMMIGLAFLQPDFFDNQDRLLLCIFGVHRLLSLFKPFPLKRLQELPGGWGVMTDDVVAGVMTLLIFYLPLESFWIPTLTLTVAIPLR